MLILSYYLGIGVIAGLFAGLLGLGGGVVMVPLLVLILGLQGYSDVMPLAIGTSLATMVFSTSIALYTHHQDKEINWALFKMLMPGIVMGSLVGQSLVATLDATVLKRTFSILLLFVAIKLQFEVKQSGQTNRVLKQAEQAIKSGLKNCTKSSCWALFIFVMIGCSIGLLSSMMGLAGGLIMISLFLFLGLKQRNAVATSMSISAPLVMLSTSLSVILGWNTVDSVYFLGFVYWPGALVMGLVTLLVTPIGIACSKKVPVRLLQRLFSAILVIVFWNMWH